MFDCETSCCGYRTHKKSDGLVGMRIFLKMIDS